MVAQHQPSIRRPRFTAEDAETAYEAWGANCGPAAIAAVCGLTLAQLRPHLGDFERKRYTNPMLMWATLDGLDVEWHKISARALRWPEHGLARIQWEGPWTESSVPKSIAYRHTHWVGAARRGTAIAVFDVNAMGPTSGWISLDDWSKLLVPYILEKCEPGANGRWSLTHAVEVQARGVNAGEKNTGGVPITERASEEGIHQ